MKNAGIYWATAVLAARDNLANLKATFTLTALTVMRILLYAAIYESAFSAGDAIMSYQNVMWSLAIFFSVHINWNIRYVYFVAAEEIEANTLSTKLMRPVSWRLTKIAEVMGGNFLAFLLQLVIMPLLLWWRVGLPDTSFWTSGFLLGFLAISGLALVTSCASFLTAGLSTLWLGDSLSVYRVLDRLVLIAGGGFVPVALMPLVMQWAVRASPFGPFAGLTQLFSESLGRGMLLFVLFALLWTIGWVKFNNWVWRKAKSKVGMYRG